MRKSVQCARHGVGGNGPGAVLALALAGALGGAAVGGCGGSGASPDGGGSTATGGTGSMATGGGSPTGGSPGAGGAQNGTGGVTGTGGTVNGAGGTTVSASSGCPLFTADDPWNADISQAAVDATWTTRLQALVGNVKIHPDFGTQFGIPINVVPASQPAIPVVFDDYPEESDPGPYPFPPKASARVEGTSDPANCDGDCHLLAVQRGSCMVYEGYACHSAADGWHCGNGARWDLKRKSVGQRPNGWTSADAAGLSIYAGLARYEEVMAGAITHALRFTVACTSKGAIPPASHDAVPRDCVGNTNAPPMGLRVRLKATFDINAYNATAQVFLRAMKKHGMILADNGSNFYFQSEQDARWKDSDLDALKNVPASAFEALAH